MQQVTEHPVLKIAPGQGQDIHIEVFALLKFQALIISCHIVKEHQNECVGYILLRFETPSVHLLASR